MTATASLLSFRFKICHSCLHLLLCFPPPIVTTKLPNSSLWVPVLCISPFPFPSGRWPQACLPLRRSFEDFCFLSQPFQLMYLVCPHYIPHTWPWIESTKFTVVFPTLCLHSPMSNHMGKEANQYSPYASRAFPSLCLFAFSSFTALLVPSSIGWDPAPCSYVAYLGGACSDRMNSLSEQLDFCI